ncbi:hypothetical protein HIM_10937 [Hirsutella minnesotensis 3608]|uniref:SCP domain-containing protein n=1 Tax=Hirsutella minnesotensis 3608 TaxID=1043627 RepID=A0A0F8A1S6_9HYPO|nr:hypothetical protein HIM_10937 [Hirsutella minnesotensis 3608]
MPSFALLSLALPLIAAFPLEEVAKMTPQIKGSVLGTAPAAGAPKKSYKERAKTEDSKLLDFVSVVPQATGSQPDGKPTGRVVPVVSVCEAPKPFKPVDNEKPVGIEEVSGAKPQPKPATRPALNNDALKDGSGSEGSGGGGPVPADAKNGFAKHNEHRKRHQAPVLTWDAEVEKTAQTKADTCQFDHSNLPQGLGQNLFMTSMSYGAGKDFLEEAVNSWYSEVKSYRYGESGFSSGTGHFTQMIWKSTAKIGCARSKKSCSGGTIVVCNYKAAGNLSGAFAENVLPPA